MTEERLRDARDVAYGELPELTRALRALGSSRRSSGSMQAQFFNPLIDARRRAADAKDVSARIRAFDAVDLKRHLDRAVERIVSAWPDERASARRAVRAQLIERVAGYASALDRLAQRSAEALSAEASPEDASRLDAWRAWTAQLAVVFDAADRGWMSLQSLVRTLPGARD